MQQLKRKAPNRPSNAKERCTVAKDPESMAESDANGTRSLLALALILLIALHFGLAKTELCHMVNLREESTRSSTG